MEVGVPIVVTSFTLLLRRGCCFLKVRCQWFWTLIQRNGPLPWNVYTNSYSWNPSPLIGSNKSTWDRFMCVGIFTSWKGSTLLILNWYFLTSLSTVYRSWTGGNDRTIYFLPRYSVSYVMKIFHLCRETNVGCSCASGSRIMTFLDLRRLFTLIVSLSRRRSWISFVTSDFCGFKIGSLWTQFEVDALTFYCFNLTKYGESNIIK